MSSTNVTPASMGPPGQLGKYSGAATLVAMAAADVELLRRAWAAFARGDVKTATEALDPQVRWYGSDAEPPDDGCHNRDDALAFIRRARDDGVSAEALEFRDAGDRVVVVLQRHQPPEWGERPEPHGEVVTVRNGKVVEMVVYPNVDEALAAAGLQPAADPRAGAAETST